jgi:serine protease Do
MKLISRSSVGFFSVMVGACLALTAFRYTSWGKDNHPDIKIDDSALNRSPSMGTSFAPIVKKVAPSVVNIYSTQIIHERVQNPFSNDPFFRQFFGNQFPGDESERTRREESLGSGVIISPNGYILTANHVVAGADVIKVAVDGNKKEYIAKVVGRDKPTDVAVLKIDAKNLPAITLGDSDKLEVGDVVLAIGNPFDVGQTVTMGIVSALGRSGFDFSGNNYDYEDFIQTDAAINPGNSGGALVDAEGRLVGINTAIISRDGGNQGIGFAVPINLARNVMDRLIDTGKVTRGYLGIMPGDLQPGMAEEFGLPNRNGALVDDVLPGTPADKVGIQAGDVIVAFNGKPITDAHSLLLAVSECSPGTEATVKIVRNGDTKTFKLKLAELPDQANGSSGGQNSANTETATRDALDGVTVSDLDHQMRQQLNVPDNINGALVTDVDPNSNSAAAGLQEGDVIMQINRHPVNDADDAVKLCKEAKGNYILLKVWWQNGNMAGTRFLSVDNETIDSN